MDAIQSSIVRIGHSRCMSYKSVWVKSYSIDMKALTGYLLSRTQVIISGLRVKPAMTERKEQGIAGQARNDKNFQLSTLNSQLNNRFRPFARRRHNIHFAFAGYNSVVDVFQT